MFVRGRDIDDILAIQAIVLETQLELPGLAPPGGQLPEGVVSFGVVFSSLGVDFSSFGVALSLFGSFVAFVCSLPALLPASAPVFFSVVFGSLMGFGVLHWNRKKLKKQQLKKRTNDL